MNQPFRFALEDNYGPEAPQSPDIRRELQTVFDAVVKATGNAQAVQDAMSELYGDAFGEALADGLAAAEEAAVDHGYTVMGRQKHMPAKSLEMERRLGLHLSKREQDEDDRIASSVFQRS